MAKAIVRKKASPRTAPWRASQPNGLVGMSGFEVALVTPSRAGRTSMRPDTVCMLNAGQLDNLAVVQMLGFGKNTASLDTQGNALPVMAVSKRQMRQLSQVCGRCHVVLPVTGRCDYCA
jgi:hypothetical protein